MGLLERGLIVSLLASVILPMSALRSSNVSVGQNAAPEDRPNVIIVVTDDQPKAGTLGVMPATRRIFQREGRTFSNGFATTPQCCPARASIFTGLYAHNHRVLNNTEGWATELDHDVTIQHHLNRAGYRTGIFGKYLNHWPLERPPAYFDEWAIFSRDDAEETGYHDVPFNVNGEIETIEDYSTTFLSERAQTFVEEASASNEPFFLYLSPWAPHAPAIPDEPYRTADVPPFEGNLAVDRGSGDELPFLKEMEVPRKWVPKFHHRQLRTLMSVDDMMADLFATLEAAGEENTIAFFISDNGYTWGEHGMLDKTVPFTPSVQVPMMMRWPGEVEGSTVDGRLTGNIDLAPTILQATGLPGGHAKSMDGRSLLEEWDRDRLLLEYWHKEGHPIPSWTSIRTKKYQYIEYYNATPEDPIIRSFFDIRRDPWQVNDLLADDDPGNDPDVGSLSATLSADAVCESSKCP